MQKLLEGMVGKMVCINMGGSSNAAGELQEVGAEWVRLRGYNSKEMLFIPIAAITAAIEDKGTSLDRMLAAYAEPMEAGTPQPLALSELIGKRVRVVLACSGGLQVNLVAVASTLVGVEKEDWGHGGIALTAINLIRALRPKEEEE